MHQMPDFGVSTFWLPAISTEEAIEKALEEGFNTFEVTTSSLGIVGYPASPNAGVDIQECNDSFRKKLSELLKDFSSATVHACHFGVNIASVNQNTRKASWDRYLEAIQFGADIGAKTVTFQPGYRERQVDNPIETLERNIAFAKEAVKLAKRLGITIGFQNLPAGAPGSMNSREMLSRVFEAVSDPTLGLLFDTAWAIKERPLSSTNITSDFILPWFEAFVNRIIKLHIHGVLAWNPTGYLHHQPLWQDNCHDFPLLVSHIKLNGMESVPMIFKIVGKDAETALRLSKQGFRFLADLFGDTEDP